MTCEARLEAQKQVVEQLRNATFEDASLLDRLMPVTPTNINQIRQSLGNRPIQSSTRSERSGGYLPAPNWNGKPGDHQQPLANLINNIGRAYQNRPHVKPPSLPMNVFDYQNTPCDKCHIAHNPCLVTLAHHGRPEFKNGESRPELHWGDVSLAVEMGNSWDAIVCQAAMHAEGLLNAHPSWTFALILGFSYAANSARFLFFHRNGVHSTPEYVLNDTAAYIRGGLNQFIHGIICATALENGKCSWTILPTAPEPRKPRRTALNTSLPLLYRAADYAYRRDSLTGKSTAGWLLKRVPPEASQSRPPALIILDTNLPAYALQPSRVTTRSQRKRHQRPDGADDESAPKKRFKGDGRQMVTHSPRHLAQDSVLGDETEIDQVKVIELGAQNEALVTWNKIFPLKHDTKNNEDLPEFIFMKDSWPAADGPDEHQIYRAMSREFGAPKLLFTQTLDTNEFFYSAPEFTKDWSLFCNPTIREDAKPFPQSHSIHLATYFATVGTPLRTAKTPRELLTTILHAMLSELNPSPPIIYRDSERP